MSYMLSPRTEIRAFAAAAHKNVYTGPEPAGKPDTELAETQHLDLILRLLLHDGNSAGEIRQPVYFFSPNTSFSEPCR